MMDSVSFALHRHAEEVVVWQEYRLQNETHLFIASVASKDEPCHSSIH